MGLGGNWGENSTVDMNDKLSSKINMDLESKMLRWFLVAMLTITALVWSDMLNKCDID